MLKHPIDTVEAADEFLGSLVAQFKLPARAGNLINVVLGDPLFWTSPAAKAYHHNWTGGLAVHTAQVLEFALKIGLNIPGFNNEHLIVAGVWHDYGKCWDYKCAEPKPKINSRWEATEHQQLIYHLPRSYAEFMIANFKRKCYSEQEVQEIGHIILAHHGRYEWQSPVTPKTIEAFALHSADMLSSQFVNN